MRLRLRKSSRKAGDPQQPAKAPKTGLQGYWGWFLFGSGSEPGYKRLVNRWAYLALIVGGLVASAVDVPLDSCASAVFLPLAGVLVGLAFAWAGNAQALLQSDEIHEMADEHPGGFVEYVYTYQTSILSILVVLVLWGLAGMKVFDGQYGIAGVYPAWYWLTKASLFAFSSIAIRECWQVVLGAQWMLISQKEIRHRRNHPASEDSLLEEAGVHAVGGVQRGQDERRKQTNGH